MQYNPPEWGTQVQGRNFCICAGLLFFRFEANARDYSQIPFTLDIQVIFTFSNTKLNFIAALKGISTLATSTDQLFEGVTALEHSIFFIVYICLLKHMLHFS